MQTQGRSVGKHSLLLELLLLTKTAAECMVERPWTTQVMICSLMPAHSTMSTSEGVRGALHRQSSRLRHSSHSCMLCCCCC